MTTDPNGNVYSLNTVGNDPIYADSFYRSSAYGAYDNLLLTSYNCSGQMRWAKLIASTNGVSCFGIIADSFGHIYVAGTFYNNGGSFHIGTDTSMSTGYICAGTIQLDTNGDFNWIRFVGQNTRAGALACARIIGTLALDKQQNIHCIKFFGSGGQITSSITSVYGTYDLAYSPTGNLLSVKRLPLDSTLIVQHAAIDTVNNKLYVTGTYNVSFGYAHEAFVAAYDTDRNLIWKDTMYSSVGNAGFYRYCH